MADLVKLTDTNGGVHYVAWASIVDVYFPANRENSAASVITTAQTTQVQMHGQAHQIAVADAEAEALRALLEQRSETLTAAPESASPPAARAPQPRQTRAAWSGGGNFRPTDDDDPTGAGR